MLWFSKSYDKYDKLYQDYEKDSIEKEILQIEANQIATKESTNLEGIANKIVYSIVAIMVTALLTDKIQGQNVFYGLISIFLILILGYGYEAHRKGVEHIRKELLKEKLKKYQ